MSPETLDNSPINCRSLYENIATQLHEHLVLSVEYPEVQAACSYFTEPDQELNRAVVLSDTQERLEAQGRIHARTIRDSYIQYLNSDYKLEIEYELQTPGNFIKSNGLDGCYRKRLREVRASVIHDSQTRLIGAIKQIPLEFIGSGVSDNEVEHAVADTEHGLYQNVLLRADEIEEAIPTRFVPIGSFEEFGLQLRGLNGNKTIDRPKTKKEEETRLTLFRHLRDAIKEFAQRNDVIPRELETAFSGQTQAYIREIISEHCQALIDREKIWVGEELRQRYLGAVALKSTERITAMKKEKTHNNDSNSQNSESPIEDQDEIARVESITTPSPFEWMNGEPTEFKLLKGNGNRLLVTEALDGTMQQIKIDSTLDAYSAGVLERLWNQAQMIELSNPNGTHKKIHKVEEIQNPSYQGPVVLRYGNLGPNAKRVYYTKTQIKRYPDLMEQLISHGIDIDEETNLLTLISMTDKANQLKTYFHLGIGRSWARARNVGSN